VSLDFAPYVATLGRGPGKSRALTREEARAAFAMVLRGDADPHQVGAFLMLLRYRGEDPEEITGLVEAARAAMTPLAPRAPPNWAALDWPSYGSGRTRVAPWFLLAALALARAGVPVLMHGSNAFSAGLEVADALIRLGLRPASDTAEATAELRRCNFAYLPLAAFAPGLDRLLGLRHLFGLRSPVNTVARLLNPADAAAGVDGVFHPPYLNVHMGVAERMARPSLLVLKGGGGEAERNPAKPAALHLWRDGRRQELVMPALPIADGPPATAADFAAIWDGDLAPPREIATITATIALGLLALGRSEAGSADQDAAAIWRARR
jgi:anthranilate phosphoribosyltransferase